MRRDIVIEPTIKTQLNIEKNKTQSKPNFIECLQHSIAKEKEKNHGIKRD